VSVAGPAVMAAPRAMGAVLRDYFALSKPRVVVLIVVATAVGFFLGSGPVVDVGRLLMTLLGTALAGGGGLALNMLVERDIDALMERTRNRPLAAGRLGATEGLAFGTALVASGLLVLATLVDPIAALMTAATVAGYLFAYTPLKRRSAVCTLVGAIPGALPPVIGWAAASGRLGAGAWALFGLLFFWQLPHSLAIARLYREDYAAAGCRLLPVVDRDGPSTGRHVAFNSLACVGAGLLPVFVGIAGSTYALISIVLGVGYVGISFWFTWRETLASARLLFLGSLVYLPVLLVALTLDRVPL